eukprot:773014-Rhodomonas_salina.1
MGLVGSSHRGGRDGGNGGWHLPRVGLAAERLATQRSDAFVIGVECEDVRRRRREGSCRNSNSGVVVKREGACVVAREKKK